MRCLVLANCTHSPMKECFAAAGIFDHVESVPVFSLDESQREEMARNARSFDTVVSLPHGPDWGELSQNALKDSIGDKAVFYTTPFFNGLHPDLIHIAQDNRRLPSVLSDYHSGLIVWGFLTGTKIKTLNEMFNDGEMPECFDVNETWSNGIQEIKRRDQSGDVDTFDIYDTLCREGPEMLTFNHPTLAILGEIAHRITSRLGFQRPKMKMSTLFNHLNSDVVFPVSPAVKKLNDLQYESPVRFRAGRHASNAGQYVNFETYAQVSYDEYQKLDWSNVRVSTPANLSSLFQPLIEAHQAKPD